MCRHCASPTSSTPIADAITPPNGIPQYIALTALPRSLGSTASDDSAIRFGIAPPSPTPVSTRTTTSIAKLDACAVAIDSKPNVHTDTISTLAPDPVGEPAAKQRPRQQAERACAERPPHLRDRQAELARHARRRDADRLQIEPFEQRDREAQRERRRDAALFRHGDVHFVSRPAAFAPARAGCDAIVVDVVLLRLPQYQET